MRQIAPFRRVIQSMVALRLAVIFEQLVKQRVRHGTSEMSGLLAANVTEDAGLVGSKDGSKCVQPQVFKVAATTAQIRLIVKKPDNSSSQFQILAQGDETFNVFVEVIYGKSSTKKYLSVDALTCMLRRSGLLAMSLSSAKAEKSCTFTICAVGLLTNQLDS